MISSDQRSSKFSPQGRSTTRDKKGFELFDSRGDDGAKRSTTKEAHNF